MNFYGFCYSVFSLKTLIRYSYSCRNKDVGHYSFWVTNEPMGLNCKNIYSLKFHFTKIS